MATRVFSGEELERLRGFPEIGREVRGNETPRREPAARISSEPGYATP